MNCDDDDSFDVQNSYEQFKKADSINAFKWLWSDFYLNKICIPFYKATFVKQDNSPHDNPEATFELGQLFSDIHKTPIPILITNSQTMIPNIQKEYIDGFVDRKYAYFLISELNRFNNIVSFWHEPTKSDFLEDFYVTYDEGIPFTRYNTNRDEVDFITNWMNNNLRKTFLTDFVPFSITNASFDQGDFYAVRCLKKSMGEVLTLFSLVDDLKRGHVSEIDDYFKYGQNPLKKWTNFEDRPLLVIGIDNAKSGKDMLKLSNIFVEKGFDAITSYEILKKRNNIPFDVMDVIWNSLPEWFKEREEEQFRD